MKPIVKWLREFSVVVTGIVFTVVIGLWVNKKNNEKDLKQYLTAVKIELELNAQGFDQYAVMLHKSVRYANYLRSNDKKSLNKDTLNYYMVSNDGFGYGFHAHTTITMTNAFEMFKNSGLMRQMEDKELLMNLWGVYSKLDGTNYLLEKFFNMKAEEVSKEKQLEIDGKPVIVPMLNFYTSELPYRMVQICKETSEIIKGTISKLEKAL